MSIEAGDVVYKFLGDTTSLDLAFDKVGPKAEASLSAVSGPADDLSEKLKGVGDSASDAGDEMESAGKRGAKGLGEARGEAALLGEAFGVHLPRHVRSFIAELPGVGEALNAAFAATAVLFLLQALSEGINKLEKWTEDTFIMTDAMKASNAATVEANKTFLQQSAALSKANEELDDFGKSKVELAREAIDGLRDKMNSANQTIVDQQNIMAGYKRVYGDAASSQKGFIDVQNDYIKATHEATIADKERQLAIKQLAEIEKEEALKSQLLTLENQKKIAVASAESEEERYQVTQQFEQRRLSLLQSSGSKEISEAKSLNAEIEAQQEEHAQKMAAMVEAQEKQLQRILMEARDLISRPLPIPITTIDPFEKLEHSAAALGITLKANLAEAVQRASAALRDLVDSGVASNQEIDMGVAKVKAAQAALDNFGKAEDNLKIKTETTWKGFQQDLALGSKSAVTAVHEMSDLSQEAFNTVSKDIQNAFASIVLGQGKVGQALEKATAQALATMASQAAVKALFYTAEGFAALATQNYGSASQFFTAAGEMGAVAVAAGVAGREMNNLGNQGGNNSTQALEGSQSNTGSQAGGRSSGVGVQMFAEGGLVTAPTLGILAESSKAGEAVIPLDDDKSLSMIAEAIGQHGGGGGIHVHVAGHVIGANDVAHLTKMISKRVQRGQATLVASDSMRLTKRSA